MNKMSIQKEQIKILPLKEEYIQTLAQLDETRLGAVDRENYLLQELERCIKYPETHLHFVAVEDDEPIGHLGMVLAGGEASIETLNVKKDGKGLATSLMLEAAEYVYKAGAESLGLEVRASNKRALKLYSKFGIAPVGIRKDYYSTDGAQREDAITMWCDQVQSEKFLSRLNEIKKSAIKKNEKELT